MNAIITGATKGIGRAIAEKFAAEGFNLALCARSEADLISFQQLLTEKHPGIEVLVRRTDMRNKADTLAFGEFVLQHWQQIDVLVNNAGAYVGGETHSEADGALELLIETNLYSAYHLTRSILPLMLAQRRGHIFNMCSIASLFAYPGGGSYTISKFALLGFTKALREELKNKGIRVTALLPGATWSDSWAGANVPENRMMSADDIAHVLWNAWQMSERTVIEEIVLRPQLGDL